MSPKTDSAPTRMPVPGIRTAESSIRASVRTLAARSASLSFGATASYLPETKNAVARKLPRFTELRPLSLEDAAQLLRSRFLRSFFDTFLHRLGGALLGRVRNRVSVQRWSRDLLAVLVRRSGGNVGVEVRHFDHRVAGGNLERRLRHVDVLEVEHLTRHQTHRLLALLVRRDSLHDGLHRHAELDFRHRRVHLALVVRIVEHVERLCHLPAARHEGVCEVLEGGSEVVVRGRLTAGLRALAEEL